MHDQIWIFLMIAIGSLSAATARWLAHYRWQGSARRPFFEAALSGKGFAFPERGIGYDPTIIG